VFTTANYWPLFCMKQVPSTALFTTHINKSVVIFPCMPMKEIINPASEQNTKGKNISVCGDGREKKTFRARFLLTCKDRHGCDVANYQRFISFT
jgi:hypothetical protein